MSNSNIYTTIEEARDLKSANRNEFEDNYKPGEILRRGFSSNFTTDFREDSAVFKIPEDNDSVDYDAFNKVITTDREAIFTGTGGGYRGSANQRGGD